MPRLVWTKGNSIKVEDQETVEGLVEFASKIWESLIGIPHRIIDDEGEILIYTDELYNLMKEYEEENKNGQSDR